MEDLKEVTRFGKKIIYWIIGVSIILSVVGLGVRSCKKATHLENAVLVYEEFQEIYNTCSKLNTDLCNMRSLPDNDKMFEQFNLFDVRIRPIANDIKQYILLKNPSLINKTL
jgi:hypothetical protein